MLPGRRCAPAVFRQRHMCRYQIRVPPGLGLGDAAACCRLRAPGGHRSASYVRVPCLIDFGDVADDAVDADWLQYISQRYPDIVETRLVVSNADAMPVVAIGERDADFIRRNSALVEEPGGAGGAPQTGESAAENQDLLHVPVFLFSQYYPAMNRVQARSAHHVQEKPA